MTVESIPEFSSAAANIWSKQSTSSKRILLSSVWCGKCRHAVTITNFTGVVKAGDLLLVGKCAECGGDVARILESA
jgi:hypothetical protein